jgi:hypothetical protein
MKLLSQKHLLSIVLWQIAVIKARINWGLFTRSPTFIYWINTTHNNVLLLILRPKLKKSNKMQQYADLYLLLNYSTCSGVHCTQSSVVHKTVVAASGTDHTVWGASFLKRDQIRTGVGPAVPHQAATTVLCSPDDGRDGRPKHVE